MNRTFSIKINGYILGSHTVKMPSPYVLSLMNSHLRRICKSNMSSSRILSFLMTYVNIINYAKIKILTSRHVYAIL